MLIDLIAGARGAGKTFRLVEWVKEGKRMPSYPGWTRVIVTHNDGAVAALRERYGLDAHQVFCAREWTMMSGVDPATEVAVDNVDLILREALRHRGRVMLATFNTGGEGFYKLFPPDACPDGWVRKPITDLANALDFANALFIHSGPMRIDGESVPGKTRDKIIAEARHIRGEIEQIFADGTHWNDCVRKPDERQIDVDPDGQLANALRGVVAMLEREDASNADH